MPPTGNGLRSSFLFGKIHDSLVAARTAGHRLAPAHRHFERKTISLRRTPGWKRDGAALNGTGRAPHQFCGLRCGALRAASGRNRERVLPQMLRRTENKKRPPGSAGGLPALAFVNIGAMRMSRLVRAAGPGNSTLSEISPLCQHSSFTVDPFRHVSRQFLPQALRPCGCASRSAR